MSRLASSKTAQIWAERIAKCERSNVPVGQFCQSIGCSLCFHRVESYSAIFGGDGLPVRRPRRTARTTDFQSVAPKYRAVRLHAVKT